LLLFLIIKPIRCTNFSNLFWNETLHVSDSSSVHLSSVICHAGLLTACNVICHAGLLTACKQDQDIPSWSCSQAVSKRVWHIPLLNVQWKTPDDGRSNCPKHVEFHSKIKFGEISASSWFCYKKLITMHSHMNVKSYDCVVCWNRSWAVLLCDKRNLL
jgi:hypothetical protein